MIGKRIRELRTKKGLSGYQLAKKIGCHHNTVYDWEKEKYEPHYKHQSKLIKEFGITRDYLMEGKK